MRAPREQVELRAHPRISAPARAFVLTGPLGRTELPVRDLSLGGIFLFAPAGSMTVGDELQLELSMPDGSFQVAVVGKVVREVLAPKGEPGVGLRFVHVEKDVQARLADLIRRLLSGSGGERRAYPRISHRISVWCTGAREVRALVKDLSLGGAGLWLDTPLAMEEQVVIHLHRESSHPLELQGRVVSTRWAMDDEPYDQAGVEFVELTDTKRNELREYLVRLLGLNIGGA